MLAYQIVVLDERWSLSSSGSETGLLYCYFREIRRDLPVQLCGKDKYRYAVPGQCGLDMEQLPHGHPVPLHIWSNAAFICFSVNYNNATM